MQQRRSHNKSFPQSMKIKHFFGMFVSFKKIKPHKQQLNLCLKEFIKYLM